MITADPVVFLVGFPTQPLGFSFMARNLSTVAVCQTGFLGLHDGHPSCCNIDHLQKNVPEMYL